MKKLVFLLVLILSVILLKPTKAGSGVYVYFFDGGKLVKDVIMTSEPSIGWDGKFFKIENGNHEIKSLNMGVMWSNEPIEFDARTGVK